LIKRKTGEMESKKPFFSIFLSGLGFNRPISRNRTRECKEREEKKKKRGKKRGKKKGKKNEKKKKKKERQKKLDLGRLPGLPWEGCTMEHAPLVEKGGVLPLS